MNLARLNSESSRESSYSIVKVHIFWSTPAAGCAIKHDFFFPGNPLLFASTNRISVDF